MSAQQTQQAEMMALAALSYTSSTMRPSGEDVATHTKRIFAGISGLLPTAVPGWALSWVGLTQDRANLAYVAKSTTASSPTYVVGLRGTIVSAVDVIEDVDVTTLVPFSVDGTAQGDVALGSMQAFTEVVMGTGLLDVVAQMSPNGTVYVTGHSLGGALVTMVSLYVAHALPGATVLPFTYAAPTAGNQAFATAFDQAFPTAQCVVNQYDVIPRAWAGIAGLYHLFPNTSTWYVIPGIRAAVDLVLSVLGTLPYAQPTQQVALNATYSTSLASDPGDTYSGWFAQAAFQHHTTTYLGLLGAPAPPATVPTVTSVSPAQGPMAGGTSVTIVGTGFTASSGVDFGVSAATNVAVGGGGTTITATSPPGAGSVDVMVTTEFGTSPSSIGDRFTFGP